MPLSPPPPLSDFDFSFDSSLFPSPPPLPSSADLFSPAETTDLLGFLDNFSFGWETDQQQYASPHAPYSNPHLNTAPEPSTSGRPRRTTRSASARAQQSRRDYSPRRHSETPSNASESSSHNERSMSNGSTNSASAIASASASAPTSRSAKPLLSTPQKRLNHIMSEQKRRNTIRDGYAQLLSILAPAGSPGIGMPQRGRPKGSGSRGKGQSKGKSGMLFRAVEYIRWLEEGRDALRTEVMRVEAAAGSGDGASR
ncbi:hypothetical protein GGX14DRAFT_465175 [Mycena pura]|uniref:BHLH domain-containing protein n=1 Tax=Mycena pura TaxID=153505 RepID=A0AAD6V393_9AGAR|nr:hypothetical protein GGX14DRAFT_465175 [Mycena pura]